MTTPQSCVCYVVDAGYLFPALVSARQARAQVSAEIADILIFLVGARPENIQIASAVGLQLGVSIVAVSPGSIGHLSIGSARLRLNRMLDPSYKRVLYLDADTQVVGSLEQLLASAPPQNFFYAARDPISFIVNDPTARAADLRAYLLQIGLTSEQMRRYFNSGVLYFSREVLLILDEVLDERLPTIDRFRFPDQDFLNIHLGGRAIPMSLRWNFPAFLLNLDYHQMISPHIVHFMSNPRPWHGLFYSRQWICPYTDLLSEYPELRRFAEGTGGVQAVQIVLKEATKRMLSQFMPEPDWHSGEARLKVARSEAETKL